MRLARGGEGLGGSVPSGLGQPFFAPPPLLFTQPTPALNPHQPILARSYEQSKELKAGAEIVVGTPGRLLDLIKDKTLGMTRVSFLVLDEADRMFALGFEAQVRSLVNQTRPDRQTLLFSATFKKRVETLARQVLHTPVRIVVGEAGEANTDVTQHAVVVPLDTHKWPWLLAGLPRFCAGAGPG